MPIARIKKQTLLFIHIPKTGGETVEHYLQSVSDDVQQMSFLRRPNANLLPCSPQHLHGAALRHFFCAGFFDYGFTVTREPIARAISEYKFRLGRRYARGARVPDFATWWTRTRRSYKKNPFVLDNHIRPQTEFLATGLARRFEVFRFEDGVVDNLAKVFARLDLPFADLGIHTHRASQVPVHMDQATFDNLVSFYANDIEQLGYQVDDMQKRHLK